MPIFDYLCDKCKNEFEALTLHSKEHVRCPGCGSLSVRKTGTSLFNCTTVQLNKRLKMQSEEQHKRGMEMAKAGTPRRKRMKIL